MALFTEPASSTTVPTPLANISIINADRIINSEGIACSSALDTSNNDIGVWESPDGTPLNRFLDPVYTLQRVSRVALFRRAALSSRHEGIYTCRIPDENMNIQLQYVGIYTAERYQGDGKNRGNYVL